MTHWIAGSLAAIGVEGLIEIDPEDGEKYVMAGANGKNSTTAQTVAFVIHQPVAAQSAAAKAAMISTPRP